MGLCADTVKACFMDESTDTNEPTRRSTGPETPNDLGSNKPLVIILIVVCLMLSIGLWARHSRAVKQAESDQKTILNLSNQVVQFTADLGEQKQVNSQLDTDLNTQREALKKLSNTLSQTSATLAKTEADAKKAAQQAAEEMAKRDARISELEGQRDDLTKRMTELNGAITGLGNDIAETQRKLAASEGDRAFLLKELKRLQTEKMELERQFNDLAMLRDQVKKLKDELSISRRLDWLRRGIYGTPKGAEKLLKPNTVSTNKNFDLNVELKQDGSVKVNTNAPAPPK